MTEQLKQYRINTNWRNHVYYFLELRNERKMNKKNQNEHSFSITDYCNGDVDYATALQLWLEFMKAEENFAFFRHFVSQSLEDARIAIKLLTERQEKDPEIRMPLLRDGFTCYSRPFKCSYGRLGVKYRLESDVGTPEPKNIHEKIIRDRDQLYAHCDLSARQPRVAKFGISLKGRGYYWEDYMKILPDIASVIENAIELTNSYVNKIGMYDTEEYFSEYEGLHGLCEQEPIFLNKLHEYESNNKLKHDAKI